MYHWESKDISVDVLFSQAGVSQSVFIRTAQTRLLIDCGDGVLRDLRQRGIKPTSLDAIAITHGHFDHMGGLYSLIGYIGMIGRTDPLPLIAPHECSKLKLMLEASLASLSRPGRFEIVKVAAEGVITVEDLSIEGHPVVHCGSVAGSGALDQVPAVGYRITHGDTVIAITGDTGMCDSVRQLVEGVDFAIIEATYSDDWKVAPEMTERVHLTESLAHELGKTAKEYTLVHKIVTIDYDT